MESNSFHLTDQDLLQALDGELSPELSGQVREHLNACWSCRGRMQSLEQAITGFVRAQRAELDPRLPPSAGPRALLKARLAESALVAPESQWTWRRGPAIAAAALLVIAIGALAIGQVAVGRSTIGELLLRHGRVKRAEVDAVIVHELIVGRLTVREFVRGSSAADRR